MIRTSWASYCLKGIPKGCRQCVKGQKLVLFITGKCTRKCFYCPLSEKRAGIDRVWANERKLSSNLAVKEAVEEAKASQAKGAGITGGDPLLVLARTCKFAKALKHAFGKAFHIHIYLPTSLVTKAKLARLAASGIDEVRFHPLFLNANLDEEVKKIALARNFDWKVGIELPVLPDRLKEIKQLIEVAAPFIGFLNLNELEFSDTNLDALLARGYKAKVDGYVVQGSQEAALKLLKWLEKKKLKLQVHYCSARTKNWFQYRNRLALRAKKTKRAWDLLTKENTFYRGALYLPGLIPSVSYEARLEKISSKAKKELLKELERKRVQLKSLVSLKFIGIDPVRLRLLCPAALAKERAAAIKALGLKPALVEELPTWEAEQLQLEWL